MKWRRRRCGMPRRRVPSMVHTGVHKKMYVQFLPGRLLDRAHARNMRFE
eukprot:gene11916-biopygen10947